MTDATDSLKDTTLDRTAKAVREGSGDDGQALAREIAKIADDMKAQDIALFDVGDALGYTDWFVVITGNTDRQTKAVHDTIVDKIKTEHRIVPRRAEGLTEATWILLDYLSVVVHIFTPDARDFYRLDRLYGDVPNERVATPDSDSGA